MNKRGIVYRATCKITGKQYIGVTIRNLEIRIAYHVTYDGCIYLHRAIKKYGIENFVFEHIASPIDPKNLLELEHILIIQEDTLIPNGYNVCSYGTDHRGLKRPLETRERMRIAQLGKKHTSERVAKRVATMMTPEVNFKRKSSLRKYWSKIDPVTRKEHARKMLEGKRRKELKTIEASKSTTSSS